MVTDIIEEGKNRGFPAIEATVENIKKSDYLMPGGESLLQHDSALKRAFCRAFYNTGDPVSFTLSLNDKRSVHSAFASVLKAVPVSGEKNFGHMIPGTAKKSGINIFDANIVNIGEKEFTGISDILEEGVLNFPGMRLESVKLSKWQKKTYLSNSAGLNSKYRKTLFHLSVKFSLKGNYIELGDSRTFFDQLDPDRLVSRGFRLLDSLTDKKALFNKYCSLIISPEASATLLRIFSKGFLPGGAKDAGKVNFPRVLNISDDIFLDKGTASVPFDDEGVQSGETFLIKKGSYISPVTDLKSAFENGLQPTGNGFRRGDSVSASFSNLFIKPTILGVKNLLNEYDEGIMVSLIKLKLAENGNYLFSAYGYKYRDGERGEAVHFYFSTTFLSYFLNIQKISKEMRFFHSGFSVGSPYILLRAKHKSGDLLVI
ncbi:MAG: metallopeptidase TldD-related protein [Acidobacteriota bacterium]